MLRCRRFALSVGGVCMCQFMILSACLLVIFAHGAVLWLLPHDRLAHVGDLAWCPTLTADAAADAPRDTARVRGECVPYGFLLVMLGSTLAVSVVVACVLVLVRALLRRWRRSLKPAEGEGTTSMSSSNSSGESTPLTENTVRN